MFDIAVMPGSSHSARQRRLAGLSLAAGLTFASILGAAASPAAASTLADQQLPDTRATGNVAPNDVFTKPRYLPFRGSALIGCVLNNCMKDGKADHGYWALDFTAPRGTTVFAAGGGIARVTQPARKCEGGKLWIDHGGGDTSRYVHLGSILVSDGQVVDQNTPIGSFGGDSCTSNSLHLTVKDDGPFPTVESDDPGELRACLDGYRTTFPAAVGYSSWNAIPFRTKSAISEGTGCWPAEPQAGPVSGVQLKLKRKKIVTRWTPTTFNRNSVVSYRIGYRHISPNTKKWNKQRFISVSGTAKKAKIPRRVFRTRWEVVVWSYDSAGASTGERIRYRLKKGWLGKAKKWRR